MRQPQRLLRTLAVPADGTPTPFGTGPRDRLRALDPREAGPRT